MAQRSRGWCITLNGQNAATWRATWTSLAAVTSSTFSVAQLEQGAQGGNVHVQAFLYYENARAFTSVKNAFGHLNPHIEAAKGSIEENVAYCTKADTRVAGTQPKWWCTKKEMEYYIRLFDFSLFTTDDASIPLTVAPRSL